jgi:hypothetical protein
LHITHRQQAGKADDQSRTVQHPSQRTQLQLACWIPRLSQPMAVQLQRFELAGRRRLWRLLWRWLWFWLSHDWRGDWLRLSFLAVILLGSGSSRSSEHELFLWLRRSK